jgi:hypothetical protein
MQNHAKCSTDHPNIISMWKFSKKLAQCSQTGMLLFGSKWNKAAGRHKKHDRPHVTMAARIYWDPLIQWKSHRTCRTVLNLSKLLTVKDWLPGVWRLGLTKQILSYHPDRGGQLLKWSDIITVGNPSISYRGLTLNIIWPNNFNPVGHPNILGGILNWEI